MTAKPRVYVSYAGEPERGDSLDGQIVESLGKALTAAGFDFHRDKTHVAYGASLTGFMQEIGAADRVVLVLSNAYFKSRYCMFELAEVEKHQAFHQRVYPVVLSDARIYDPVEIIDYLDFWERKQAELAKKLKTVSPTYTANIRAELDRYADYRRMLDGMLALLADMNALTRDIHVGSDFAQLIERLQGTRKPELPPISVLRKPDSQFIKELTADLWCHLEKLPEGTQSKLAALRELSRPDSETAQKWHEDPSLPINEVLAPAIRQLLERENPDSPQFKIYWAQAKNLLGCLCLYAVKEEVVEQFERTHSLGRLHIELAVTTKCSVEVVHARFLQVPARFIERPEISDPRGSHGIDPLLPFEESGWNGPAALDAVLRMVWKTVFSRDSLPNPDYPLSRDVPKLQRLDGTILSRLKNTGEHHYLCVELPAGFSIREDLFKSLKECLPNLGFVMFRSGANLRETALRNESLVIVAIQEFLMIPTRIREAL